MTDPGAPDLGQVRINPKEPSLHFPVTVNQRNGPVERPLFTDQGKTHESVFRTDA